MASQNDQPYTTSCGTVSIMKQQLSMKIIMLGFVQNNAGYIKGNIIRYIASKLFYGEIETLQTKT